MEMRWCRVKQDWVNDMVMFILDRDGVINQESSEYIKSPDEWIPIPGSVEAVGALSQAGHRIVIATNQSGVNRGLYTTQTLEKIHTKMVQAINDAGGKIEGVYFCSHHPDEQCNCRKPKPGLFQQILRDFPVKNSDIVSIGDSVRDYDATCAMGFQFVLVRTGNGKKTEKALKNVDILVFDDLAAAVKHFIGDV